MASKHPRRRELRRGAAHRAAGFDRLLAPHSKHPRTSFGRDPGVSALDDELRRTGTAVPVLGDAMSTLTILTTVQPPSDRGSTTSLFLLLIGLFVLIVIGNALVRDIGTLAAVATVALAGIFASLRTLMVVLLAALLVIALAYLAYAGKDSGASAPPGSLPHAVQHSGHVNR